MGWFSTDYLRFGYSDAFEYLRAKWQGSNPMDAACRTSGTIPKPNTHGALAALNHGRLVVNQRETRADLFHRVSDVAERLVQGQKEFAITVWSKGWRNRTPGVALVY